MQYRKTKKVVRYSSFDKAEFIGNRNDAPLVNLDLLGDDCLGIEEVGFGGEVNNDKISLEQFLEERIH